MENRIAKTVSLWRVENVSGRARLVDLNPAAPLESFDAAVPHLPQGAYTTLRTYNHRMALHLEAHFDRLEDTARLAGQPVRVDRQMLRQALRLVIGRYAEGQEIRLRLIVDLKESIGQLSIAAAPLITPTPEEYAAGVRTITCTYERPNPKAKLTASIINAAALRKALPPGVNEALIVSPQGKILEGLSSNFFAVKDGELFTADKEVLSGITRQIILEEAFRAKITVCWSPFPVSELPLAQEAFISSSSRAVLPVHQVDNQPIGTGAPGPVTELLSQRYRERLESDLDSI